MSVRRDHASSHGHDQTGLGSKLAGRGRRSHSRYGCAYRPTLPTGHVAPRRRFRLKNTQFQLAANSPICRPSHASVRARLQTDRHPAATFMQQAHFIAGDPT